MAAGFAGAQAAVCALIVRAVHRIGAHAMHDRALWAIALLAAGSQAIGVHFAVPIVLGGLAYAAVKLRRWAALGFVVALFLGAISWAVARAPGAAAAAASAGTEATAGAVFVSGLRGGLLTFGGAYTVIPFLRRDAVEVGGWMTDGQFLDALALSGILPAPLIIFGTMVGYLARGPLGALVMTIGLFLPAFSFTLIGHAFFERVIDDRRLHAFLDGVTAAVVGIIAATAVSLTAAALGSVAAGAIFAASLATVYLWRSRLAIPAVVIGAGLAGLLVMRAA
jgi:chromate transporter